MVSEQPGSRSSKDSPATMRDSKCWKPVSRPGIHSSRGSSVVSVAAATSWNLLQDHTKKLHVCF